MRGQLGAYFDQLAAIGRSGLASDKAGRSMPLDDAVAWAVTQMEDRRERQGHVLFVGNGGSAGIASHMAIDYSKNGNIPALAFNDGAALTCLSNDLGYENVFSKQVSLHGRSGDLLVAISSSGRSASILNAVKVAQEKGITVITLSGFSPDNPLRTMGDVNFFLDNDLYGFVEIGHLAICHAILDLTMNWRAEERASELRAAS